MMGQICDEAAEPWAICMHDDEILNALLKSLPLLPSPHSVLWIPV